MPPPAPFLWPCLRPSGGHVGRHPRRPVQLGIALAPGQIEHHLRGPGTVDHLGPHLFQPDLGGLGFQNLVVHPGTQERHLAAGCLAAAGIGFCIAYLFVAIDRATRWVFIRVFKSKTAANARRFLRDLERACPLRIRTILTDNGKEFTDRLFGLRKREATDRHEFNQLCADLGIEHRLAPPQHPQTNGIPLGDCGQSPAGQRVERFNGRIEDVLQSRHFRSGEELETTLHRYVALYNQQLPQSALGSKTPLQAKKDWHKLKSELCRK